MKLEFGYFLPPKSGSYPELLRQARLCEALDLNWISIQDHPYQSRFLDTWTLLAALAAQTERIGFFPNVANLPLRPPAMLAKAAASLDEISGGRIELGLGAGAFWNGVQAMGGPQREPGEAVEALEEAVQVIRLMWSGERGVRFAGEYYFLQGAHAGPVPAHPMRIIIGAVGPRMLALTGRIGDGWVPSSPYVPPDKLLEAHDRIDEAAQKAGRSPGDIRRLYNIFGTITSGVQEGLFKGPVDHWVDALADLVLEKRVETLIFGPEQDSLEQIRLFGEEVVPRLREISG
jgi:alkanesulfonate monooxygenase SsuD/methylene tetrahydromethanopterin reductase-like flavin-dependent oxidoreductase (luciferase family)